MPDITGGESLVLHWSECGMYGSGANGATPLSWQELRAYSLQSGVMLDGWDSKHIIRMSRAYVNIKGQANNKDCFAPYQRILSEEEIIIRDNEVFEEFKRLRAARK